MKKLIFVSLLLAFTVVSFNSVYADENITITSPDFAVKSNDNKFMFCPESGKIEDYIGSDSSIIIPENIDGSKITWIGGNAFNHKGLKSVFIPSSVEKIWEDNLSYYGTYPFKGEDIEEIQVSKDNNYFKSEDGVLFSKNGDTLLCYPCNKKDKLYKIPESVTFINSTAFDNCDNLEYLVFENDTISAGTNAFMSNKNLTFVCNSESSATEIAKTFNITTENFKVKLLGDIDEDKSITANDAAIALAYARNKDLSLTPLQILNLDISKDNRITATTAAKILAKAKNNAVSFN